MYSLGGSSQMKCFPFAQINLIYSGRTIILIFHMYCWKHSVWISWCELTEWTFKIFPLYHTVSWNTIRKLKISVWIFCCEVNCHTKVHVAVSGIRLKYVAVDWPVNTEIMFVNMWLQFWHHALTGYYDPERLRHAGDQDTHISHHVPISTNCCTFTGRSTGLDVVHPPGIKQFFSGKKHRQSWHWII